MAISEQSQPRTVTAKEFERLAEQHADFVLSLTPPRERDYSYYGSEEAAREEMKRTFSEITRGHYIIVPVPINPEP